MLIITKKVIPKPIFKFFQPLYHFLLALTGNILYGFPGYKMTVIGVTGTNGKSTTSELICEILKAEGHRVGMISTVSIEIAGSKVDNKTNRTTLGRWKTQKLLRRMVQANCDFAVIEVASEAIAWFRIFGIPFDCAVFTNLAPEHLNFHKTMENYRNTKGKLFRKLSSPFNIKKHPRVSVVNADDKEASYFLQFEAQKKFTFGLEKGDVRAKNVDGRSESTKYLIEIKEEKYEVETGAIGKFNVYNELAAFCVGLGYGISKEKMIQVLKDFQGTIGRAESIKAGQEFTVIVDYAVTPDAQRAVYEEFRKFTKGKLISVFGATGDRDRAKRPAMGKIAAKLTDIVILTDDETYHEESRAILDEVYAGVPKHLQKNTIVCPDRYQAINKALKMAQKGDTVVITGIGHQKYRTMNGQKIAWDERQIVFDLLKNMREGKESHER